MPQSSLRLRQFANAAEFYRHAESYLLQHEAVNCLPLGLTSGILNGVIYDDAPYFTAVYDDHMGQIVAVAVRTPPFRLILTKCHDIDALPLIAQHAYETYGQLPGASGEKAIVAQFVAHWVKLTGHRAVVSMNERIYQNEQVIPPQGVSGSFRLATRDDFELLVKWGIAFTLEAFGTVNEAQVERTLRNRFDHNTGGYGLWMDDKGAEVSMAGYGGYTPNGVRIGPVYTPVEYRGRGYGRAVTAAVTQMHHDNGRRYVFLFTDLMNPTSNHIYMQIGYQPVTDVDEYRFEPAPATHV